MSDVIRNTYCLYCGGTLAGCRAGAEVCSPSCRVRLHRALAREEAAGSPYASKAVIRGLGISIMEPIKMHPGGRPRKRNSKGKEGR